MNTGARGRFGLKNLCTWRLRAPFFMVPWDNGFMGLQYLIFESSDDGQGQGSWDAMASVRPTQLEPVLNEVRAVLTWAETHNPGPHGPPEEGGVWDTDLHQQTEGEWTTVTLTLTGPCAWGEALLAALGQDL
jgi:hypothetical protein